MCSVLIFNTNKMNQSKISFLKEIFVQSKIRGLHSTGFSFIDKNENLKSYHFNKPADEVMDEFDFSEIDGIENFKLVGHTRYSTSDIKYPQPIFDSNSSLVHNGIITQKDPSFWKDIYKFDFKTKNDSEILFHEMKKNFNPFFSNEASVAGGFLDVEKGLFAFRNGKRPLYVSIFDDLITFTSTKDILLRANEAMPKCLLEQKLLIPGFIYKIDKQNITELFVKEIIDNNDCFSR